MVFTLYCVTCIPTQRLYVGITSQTVNQRGRHHVRVSRWTDRPNKFHIAIQQYGEDSFIPQKLFIYPTAEEAGEAEAELIAHLNLVADGYNTALGGEISPMHSPAVAAKVAAANRGKALSLERRAKISATMKGRKQPPRSEEWRRNNGLARRGKKASPETRKLLSAAMHRRWDAIKSQTKEVNV